MAFKTRPAFKKPGFSKPGAVGGGSMHDDDPYTRALSKRHQQQVSNKDHRGTSRKNTLIDYANLPEGFNIWYAKEGSHLIDIIPFFAGPDMPMKKGAGDPAPTEEGEPDYLVDIEVHTRIGEPQTDFVCPNANFGLPCPICSFITANRLEKEDWKKVKTTRRVFYFVWVHDTPEEEAKGLQIWPVAHFIMEHKLDALTKLPQGGGIRVFSHPTNGFNISFEVQKDGNKLNYIGHGLWPRNRPIPKKLLERAFPLDSIIKMHPKFEEIEAAFNGMAQTLGADEQQAQGGLLPPRMEDDVPLGTGGSGDWYSGEDAQPSAPPTPPKRSFPGKSNPFKRRG